MGHKFPQQPEFVQVIFFQTNAKGGLLLPSVIEKTYQHRKSQGHCLFIYSAITQLRREMPLWNFPVFQSSLMQSTSISVSLLHPKFPFRTEAFSE